MEIISMEFSMEGYPIQKIEEGRLKTLFLFSIGDRSLAWNNCRLSTESVKLIYRVSKKNRVPHCHQIKISKMPFFWKFCVWIFIFYPQEIHWMVWGLGNNNFQNFMEKLKVDYNPKLISIVMHLKCLSVAFEYKHFNFLSKPKEMSGWTYLGSSMVLGWNDFRI